MLFLSVAEKPLGLRPAAVASLCFLVFFGSGLGCWLTCRPRVRAFKCSYSVSLPTHLAGLSLLLVGRDWMRPSPRKVHLHRPCLRACSLLKGDAPRPSQANSALANSATPASKRTPAQALCPLAHSFSFHPLGQSTRSAGPRGNTARYALRHIPRLRKQHTGALRAEGTD